MDIIDTHSIGDRVILNLVDLSPKNILVLGHYNYKQVGKELEMHRHEGMIEICFLDKGTQHYKIESNQYTLKGGDLLITKPSQWHGTSGYPEEKGSLYWLIIKVPDENQKLLNLTAIESQNLINRLLAIPFPHFRGTAYLKTILNKIFATYQRTEDPIRIIELFNYVLEFLIRVIYCGERRSNGEVSEIIKKICRHIDENVFELIELKDLAELANLSESRFKHRFKEEIGIPPAEYVLRKKIEQSQKMIQKTQLSIQDIAYDLNFSSSPYFATVFKRFIGMAPLDYRNLKNTGRSVKHNKL